MVMRLIQPMLSDGGHDKARGSIEHMKTHPFSYFSTYALAFVSNEWLKNSYAFPMQIQSH